MIVCQRSGEGHARLLVSLATDEPNSIPPVTGNFPLPPGAKTAVTSCLLLLPQLGRGRCHSRTLLRICKLPLSIKPLMSLSLTLGSLSSVLRLGKYWACRPVGHSLALSFLHAIFSIICVTNLVQSFTQNILAVSLSPVLPTPSL